MYIIKTENAIPGAYQQTCMNLDERSFVLESTGGDKIVVYQGTNNNNTKGGGGGTTTGRTGGEIWTLSPLSFFILLACFLSSWINNGTMMYYIIISLM